MKRWMTIGMIVMGITASASALYLEQWQFNDAAGVNLNAVANTGSHGSSWTYGAPASWEIDGVGNMIAKGANTEYEATGLFPGGPLAGAGVYSLEMKISDWEVESGADQSRLTYRLQTAGGANVNVISFRASGAGALFKFGAANSNWKDVIISGGLSGGAVTARIDFDVVNGTAEYFVDGVSVMIITGISFPAMEKLHFDQEAAWTATTPVIKVDEVNLSFVSETPPTGAFLLSSIVAVDSNSALTNAPLATFSALAGDVVVVMAAASGNTDPLASSIALTNGTASIDPVSYGVAGSTATAHYWYSTVTADGTVEVDRNRDGSTYWPVAAYHLRSATGTLALLAEGSDQGNTRLSAANTYSFAQTNSGLYFEAVSTFSSSGVTADNLGTLDDVSSNDSKRRVAHGEFTDATSFTNSWTLGAESQVGLVGLAFVGVDTSTPQSSYDAWMLGFSVGGLTDMFDDPDGDNLDNLTEYAFGGAPDDIADQGNTPYQTQVNDGGINYLEYTYYERDNAAGIGIASVFEVGSDLVVTSWADGSVYEVGSGASGIAGFNAVTNRVPTNIEDKQFLRLQIEFTP